MGPRGPPGPSGAPVSTYITAPHHEVVNHYKQKDNVDIHMYYVSKEELLT